MKKYFTKRGNSLLEYVLPLMIFFVSGIGASFAFDLPGRIALFFQTSVSADKDGTTMKVKGLGTLPQGTVLPPELLLLSVPTQTVSFTTSTEEAISLPYISNLSESIETAGANGTTTLLIGSLETLIAHAELLGELDPEQVKILRALANQGHRIALIEQTMETMDTMASQVLKSTVTFEDQEYPKDDLARKVSTSGEDGAEFLALYQEAIAQGALKDPTMGAVISHLVQDILLTSDAFYEVVLESNSAFDFKLNNEINSSLMASKVTDEDSKGICDTSGNTSKNGATGLSCS